MSRWTILRITVYIATTRAGSLALAVASGKKNCLGARAVARDALGMGHAVALRVVDAELAHYPQDGIGLHPLGDGGDAHGAPDPADRGDHGAVDRIVSEVAHELAV